MSNVIAGTLRGHRLCHRRVRAHGWGDGKGWLKRPRFFGWSGSRQRHDRSCLDAVDEHKRFPIRLDPKFTAHDLAARCELPQRVAPPTLGSVQLHQDAVTILAEWIEREKALCRCNSARGIASLAYQPCQTAQRSEERRVGEEGR